MKFNSYKNQKEVYMKIVFLFCIAILISIGINLSAQPVEFFQLTVVQ